MTVTVNKKELRALDALVHAVVFGKKTGAPKYTEDIAEAWKVLRHELEQWGGCFTTWGHHWGCVFGDGDVEKDGAVSEHAPLAICLAVREFYKDVVGDEDEPAVVGTEG